MARRITLQTYVAYNNPSGARKVLKKYQLPEFMEEKQIQQGLTAIINKYPEQGLTDITKLAHPDFELFKEVMAETKQPEVQAQVIKEVTETPKQETPENTTPKTDKSNVLIYGVLGLVGLIVLVSVLKD